MLEDQNKRETYVTPSIEVPKNIADFLNDLRFSGTSCILTFDYAEGLTLKFSFTLPSHESEKNIIYEYLLNNLDKAIRGEKTESESDLIGDMLSRKVKNPQSTHSIPNELSNFFIDYSKGEEIKLTFNDQLVGTLISLNID